MNATTWSDKSPRGFGDRANFDPSKVQLSVNGIKAHEGGLYRCRVDFQRSQTSNVLVNLTVIGNGPFKNDTKDHLEISSRHIFKTIRLSLQAVSANCL